MPVVEDFKVLEDRIGQLDAGSPAPAVQEFDLHARPERLDDGVIEAAPDRAHQLAESRVQGALGEGPGGELGADLQLIDPPSGPFIAVEAGVRRACGLRPGGEIDCWGIDDEASTPPPGPFATAPITAATAG